MNKMKILYIITKAGVGGAQKYVTDLANNLDKSKFETKILYGGKDINPHTKQELLPKEQKNKDSRNGVRVKWLSNKTYPWLLFFNDWMAIFELIKVYKIEKPNIVHLNSSKTGVLGSLAAFIYNVFNKNKAKVVFTAHGWVFNTTNNLSHLKRLIYAALHKTSSLFQNKIICVSNYDYKLAIAYNIAPSNKLTTIHNGIDPNIKFLDKKEAKSYLKFKIENLKIKNQESLNPEIIKSLNNDWPWIGSIGRLTKEKNFQTFVEAAALIPETYFFIVGEGEQFNDLKLKIENSKLTDRFFLIPPDGDDYKYLKAFDIFVMSSVKEGLPYILLEALAAELPCIVTNIGGIPEVIKNGQNGVIIRQKNPELLSQAINKLINNKELNSTLSKNTKQSIIQEFSLKKMVTETEKIYNDLMI